MRFRKDEGRIFRFNGIDGVAYTSASDCASGDIAIINVNGSHGPTTTTLSDRFYFVIEGAGHFTINEKVIPVIKDDVVVVHKKTPYDFAGSMRLALFCSPAFDPAAEVDLSH